MAEAVPFLTGKAAETLSRILRGAASRTNTTPHHVSLVLTYILEGVAEELCKGNEVIFPAFGGFFPFACTKMAKAHGRTVVVKPFFHANAGLRRVVNEQCPPGAARNKRATGYQINNQTVGGRRDKTDVFRGLAHARAHVLAQLERSGRGTG
jgi:hypothetical protein